MAEDIPQRYLLIVSDTTPNLPGRWEEHLMWLKPSTGEWYKWTGSEWGTIYNPVIQSELEGAINALSSVYASIGHSHPTHGDINFTGKLEADGQEGLTGERTIAGHVLIFKKGLLIGYQPP